MSSNPKVKKGDRVKVTIEGVVDYASKNGADADGWFEMGDHVISLSTEEEAEFTIEILKPPRPEVKAGQVWLADSSLFFVRPNGERFTFISQHPGDWTTSEMEFFDSHPDAELVFAYGGF